MTRLTVFVATIILFSNAAFAQSVSITTDGSQPAAGAMLDIKHIAKGVLIPRIALTGYYDSITVPDRPLSLLVYNTASTGGSDAVQPGYYFWNNGKWNRLVADDQSSMSGWLLGGNKGTNATHFIGTKDSVALQFKVADSKAGYVGMDGHTAYGYEASKTYNFNNVAIGRRTLYYSFGMFNVAIGDSTLFNNISGFDNTATGSQAMLKNTYGFRNTATGVSALFSNTTGSENIAIGGYALYSNTEANANVAVGYQSLFFNVSGISNTAIGNESIKSNVSGSYNTASGYRALGENVTGSNNCAFGNYSLNRNTSGRSNTSMGSNSMEKNTSGEQNIAIGYLSLTSNTTGTGNTAIGTFSMIQNQTGNENTAIGLSALAFNATGSDNIAIGSQAMKMHQTGNLNVAIGDNALGADVSGAVNVAIGANALASSQAGNFQVAVGNAALASTTTGFQNVAVGSTALFSNTTGNNNTALGYEAGRMNNVGNGMTAIGTSALFSNTSGVNNTAVGFLGLLSNSTGNYNSAFGNGALSGNTTGGNNTAIGAGALNNNTTGTLNTVVGFNADVTNPNQTNSTAIGANAIAGCNNCMVLGSNAKVGINLSNPAYPLNFNSDLGDKISLFGTLSAHYGLGIQNLLLQIHSDAATSDIALGYGSSSTFTENFRVKGNGNVIMGTANSAATLKFGQSLSKKIILFTGGTGGEAAIGVFANELRLQADYSGAAVTFGHDNAGSFVQNFRVQGNGDGVLRGSMFANGVLLTSDSRMKKDITVIDQSLDKITQLHAYHYYWEENNEDASLQTGVIAQEVQQLFPELVKQTANGTLTVNYTGLIPYLIQGVKEQQSEIDGLKKEVEELKAMVKKLAEIKN